mmetsp:Transcript_1850/g.4887  ORF Transcript_1850/g.4887 Transcript_1850/m.4887 type:complete len:526 (+) Transcript_1850:147-1724(+)
MMNAGIPGTGSDGIIIHDGDSCEHNITSTKVASSISTREDEQSLSLSSQGLTTLDLHRYIDTGNLNSQQRLPGSLSSLLPAFLPSRSIVRLDLSRNKLTSLPRELFGGGENGSMPCPLLEFLDVGRNALKELPPEIADCKRLKTIIALSNKIRWSGFPADAISSLPSLRVIDLRWNQKMNSQSSRRRLLEIFPQGSEQNSQDRVKVLLSPHHSDSSDLPKKLSACDRDANELRSQLEPLSTPQLRKRLLRTFGVEFDDRDETAYDRQVLMERLLQCYRNGSSCEEHGDSVPLRSVRYERGVAIETKLEKELLEEMKAIRWPRTTRERPKISAEGYVILQRPPPSALPPGAANANGETDQKSQKARNKAKREAEKLKRFIGIWTKAVEAIESIDKVFAQQFTALAVTKNFRGSPHIDTLNIAPFYGLSLGDFTPRDRGGKLCVECSATQVAEIDTRGRLAKVDGRFCHWVSDYEGTRYSLIYYVTHGEVVPQTTAIFQPPYVTTTENDGEHDENGCPWVPPPKYVV